MAISDKSRKLLWGRSANRCAYCKRRLDFPRTSEEPEAIVGVECHIHSKSPEGPRYDPAVLPSALDEYPNLILLCGVHHSLVDQRPLEYSADALTHLRTHHERWVQEKLRRPSPSAGPRKDSPIPRLTSGKDLFNILAGAEAFDFDYDEPSGPSDVDLIARFLQDAQDCGDLAEGMEAAQRVHAARDFSGAIRELELAGYVLFADRRSSKISFGGRTADWSVAVIRLGRPGSPSILKTRNAPPSSQP